MRRPALFLDRDGVINVDHGYVCRKEDIEFIPGIFELVRQANQYGYQVIVVTNQAGIGRGYYTEADFHHLMSWIQRQFSQQGAHIDAVYHSSCHPEAGIGEYRKESPMRKPQPGMLLKAATELNLDLENSIMVGDKPSDMQAAASAGLRQSLYMGKEPVDYGLPITSLQEARDFLQRHYAKSLKP